MEDGSVPSGGTKKLNIGVEEPGLSRCFWEAEHVGSNPTIYTKIMRVSYNGYYSFLPSRRRGFDSSHPLTMASRISVITSGFGPDKWGSIPWEPTGEWLVLNNSAYRKYKIGV